MPPQVQPTVQRPDTVLIRTEGHKGSKDLWGRAEKLLLRVSKNSWGSCENHPLCKYHAAVCVPVACTVLPLSPYGLAFSVPLLYHLCTHMGIDVYPYWSIQPMHYLIEELLFTHISSICCCVFLSRRRDPGHSLILILSFSLFVNRNHS